MSRIWLLLSSRVGSPKTFPSQWRLTPQRPHLPIQKFHPEIRGPTFSLLCHLVPELPPLKVRSVPLVCMTSRTRCTAVSIACTKSGEAYAHNVVATTAVTTLMRPVMKLRMESTLEYGVFYQQWNKSWLSHMATT